MSRILPVCLLAFSLCTAAMADGAPDASTAPQPAPAKDDTTLYLGDISVTGQAQIVAALQTIKSALREPLSNDPAHADDLVCRISKGLGEQREYLDCATNRYYTRERDALHGSILAGTNGLPHGGEFVQGLKAMIERRPNHSIHVPVQGGALQALLAQIPDAPAEATQTAAAPAATQPAPAAATGG